MKMNNKKIFVAPEAEIIKFPKQDIVTTSGGEINDESDILLGGGRGIILPDENW